jgi:hypothetical protein
VTVVSVVVVPVAAVTTGGGGVGSVAVGRSIESSTNMNSSKIDLSWKKEKAVTNVHHSCVSGIRDRRVSICLS